MDVKTKPSVTGKQRVVKIPFGYHHRRDKLSRRKVGLSVLALVLTPVVWLCWGVMAKEQSEAPYSHGPLAAVHATWENKCEACHVDFAPIKDDAWSALSWLTLSAPQPHVWEHLSDKKCEVCHPGPEHHGLQKREEVASCASCHRDHSGRLASIVRTDDRSCTECHADLASHMQASRPDAFENVTRFDLAHPAFRSLKSDPGTIRFTHNRHVTAGLKIKSDDKLSLTLADLSEADRARYRRTGQSDADLVQLDCASCHQPDQTGRYMQPVTFEENCRACHALAIEPGTQKIVPHGLSPDAVRDFLRTTYLREYVEQNPDLLEKKIARPPVPSMNKAQDPDSAKAAAWVEEKASRAERHLLTVCGHCHQDPPTGEPKLAPVLPARIPQVWLQHARFDHAAHRAVECRSCHEKAFADHPDASKGSQDVMIVNREKCLECHSPLSSDGKRGGARFDCAECHRYHGADHPIGHGKPEAKP